MFRGFNVVGCQAESFGRFFKFYEKVGRNLCAPYVAKAAVSLKHFAIGDGHVLDASAIQNHWFPTYKDKFDIFISHSHDDESLAYALAGWIKRKMGLNCFVDGEIWNSADGLIGQLDKLCQPEAKIFDYKKRNLSTSQIHAMLSIAIMQMIDNCEGLFFLNTNNSIPIKTAINNLSLSPWLYLEIGISKIVQKKKNLARQHNFSTAVVEAAVDVGYDLDLSHLKTINVDDICKWYRDYKNQKDVMDVDNFLTGKSNQIYPLDVLYNNHPITQIICG